MTANKPWKKETNKLDQNLPITTDTGVPFWTGWQIPLSRERLVKMINGNEKLNCVQ